MPHLRGYHKPNHRGVTICIWPDNYKGLSNLYGPTALAFPAVIGRIGHLPGDTGSDIENIRIDVFRIHNIDIRSDICVYLVV